jgi:Glycosyltransferases involved in cell wall biogenesis
VPVYNAEKYLHRCINSILSQTFIDFELLLINDGSKDGSGKICDEYAEKDCRIRVFHKENSGVSSTRNLGLEHSIGEYIAFIDSDDYIDKDYLKSFSLHYDFSMQGYIVHGKNDEICRYKHIVLVDKVGAELVWKGFTTSPWGKLFRRDIIKNNAIYFPCGISYGEDSVFIYHYLTYCTNAYITDAVGYHYIVYPYSLGHKKHPFEHLLMMFKLQFKYIKQLFENSRHNYLHRKTLLTLAEMMRLYQLSRIDIKQQQFLNDISIHYLNVFERMLLRSNALYNKYIGLYISINKRLISKLRQ